MSDELLTPRAHARRTDPSTSHEAAEGFSSEKLRVSQRAVLAILRSAARPLTDIELIALYRRKPYSATHPNQTDSGLRTRRAELVERGVVVPAGTVTYHGRRHTLWRPL